MLLPRALFVAREPDETLRTYLPVLRALCARGRVEPRVLFHHTPGAWARAELDALGVGWREVSLPALALPGPLARLPGGATARELIQLRRARALAGRVVDEERPAVLTVIQDTLLLERFLVRLANRRGATTLAIQWAFTYPQAYYDRFHPAPAAAPGPPSSVTSRAYRLLLELAGARFELANTYGGGEAQYLAVMGQAFKEQFLAQGARKRAILVTGHPSHDLAFERATSWTAPDREGVLADLGLPLDTRLVTYATQPTLWRGVLSPQQLKAMVETVADAVVGLGPAFALVVKLHPREDPADYRFLAARPGVRLVKNFDIQRLIAAADAFVSSSSSTLLYAMMYGKPIVTVNFNAVPHFDVFESLGGTLHVTDPQGLPVALDSALEDGPARTLLLDEQRQVLTRYTVFDGGATTRLTDLVEGWALGRPRP